MKFLYEYQDKANKRHKGTLNAATRADAYATLKEQGIKPIHCEEAPGFFNLLFGKGKRWIAIGVLAIACVTLVVIIRSTPSPSTYTSFDDTTRRQILGDAAIIEKGIRTGWSDVFELEGDRFFASFAIPGVKAGVGTSNVAEIEKALAERVEPTQDDGVEFRQIKAMVEGMKNELRQFIRDGGSIRAYGRKLAMRQDAEIAIYTRAKTELETLAKSGVSETELEELWERRNDELRAMGVRLISMPERR